MKLLLENWREFITEEYEPVTTLHIFDFDETLCGGNMDSIDHVDIVGREGVLTRQPADSEIVFRKYKYTIPIGEFDVITDGEMLKSKACESLDDLLGRNCTQLRYLGRQDEFIHRFFDKRSPKGLEGIWHWGQWSILGIVREGSVYQMYDIDVIAKNQWKINKGAIDSFFDGLTGEQNSSQNIDYHLCNGTKGGALIPTKAKNKFKLNCNYMRIKYLFWI